MRKISASVVYFPLLVVPLILLAPLILTGKAMFWGTPALQFVPWRAYAWDVLAGGHLPLWNPLLGMGAPLLANYQSALLYPPNWILFIMDSIGGVGWAAWGQAILVWAHLAFAGVGMAYLGRRIGLGTLAQTVSGLAFGLSGYLVARSGFLSINAAAAWLPWILLLSTNDKAKPGIFHAGTIKLSLLFGMQFLAGHAQTAWYTILLALFWSGITGGIGDQRVKEPQEGKYDRLKDIVSKLFVGWICILIGILLGFLLAAIQLLPTAEYLLQSQRSSSIAYDYALTYSFWPWRLLTLIAPSMFGSPVQGDYWGYGNYWEDALYIGLLPFAMALGAILAVIWGRIKRKKSQPQVGSRIPKYSLLVFSLFGLIIVSILLALGNRTPIYPWLFRNIPTFSLFQAPTRFSIWAEFSLALLAGIGVQMWRRPQGRGLYWARLGTAGAFAISLGAGLAWYFLGGISPTFIRATALAGFWGLCTGFLTLLAPPGYDSLDLRDLQYRVWVIAVVLVVSADLLLANWGLIPGIEQSFYSTHADNYNAVNAMAGSGRLYLPEEDEYSLKFDRFMRFDSFSINEDWLNLRAVYLPNLTLLESLSSANNFDPILPSRYADWMESLQAAEKDADASKYLALMNLMGVGLVENKDISAEFGVSFLPIRDTRRARWVPCARFVPDQESARNLVFEEGIDFDREVVIESSNPTFLPRCSDVQVEGNVDILADNPNHLVLSSSSTISGWLVLSDVWYPGWQAKVDGVSVEILRANYLFRSIYLGEGEHTIEFDYRPVSFWLGTGLTLSAMVCILVVWYRLSKREYEPYID